MHVLNTLGEKKKPNHKQNVPIVFLWLDRYRGSYFKCKLKMFDVVKETAPDKVRLLVCMLAAECITVRNTLI